jgi:hypothetical protein
MLTHQTRLLIVCASPGYNLIAFRANNAFGLDVLLHVAQLLMVWLSCFAVGPVSCRFLRLKLLCCCKVCQG